MNERVILIFKPSGEDEDVDEELNEAVDDEVLDMGIFNEQWQEQIQELSTVR